MVSAGGTRRAIRSNKFPFHWLNSTNHIREILSNWNRSNKSNKWHFEAFDKLEVLEDGTFELCGPKIQGNPEKLEAHELIKHSVHILDITDLTFEGIKLFLVNNDIEGVVFHHKTDKNMCKIRKTDFGIKR